MNFVQKFIRFHYELFLDERGGVSIKPFLAYLCTIYLCMSLAFTVYLPEAKPSDSIVNAIMMIAMACLGADTADKFSLKGKHDKPDEPDEDRYTDPEKR
jgi:hypothetical protein